MQIILKFKYLNDRCFKIPSLPSVIHIFKIYKCAKERLSLGIWLSGVLICLPFISPLITNLRAITSPILYINWLDPVRWDTNTLRDVTLTDAVTVEYKNWLVSPCTAFRVLTSMWRGDEISERFTLRSRKWLALRNLD